MIREAIDLVVAGQSLDTAQATAVMREIMEGAATPAQLGAFLTALRLKGETDTEIAALAAVMRDKALPVSVPGQPLLLDVVGTGGDGKNTFNLSTAAALIAAAAGVKVAKHGNRAASGSCGAADVLEALGVQLELSPAGVAACIARAGMGFMFAPAFHPAMRHAGPVRREIGIRTVFNLLGPLTNPARAQCMLLGVADPNLGERMAAALGRLQIRRALVVHGADGMDELTLSGPTTVWEVHDDTQQQWTLHPADYGLPPAAVADLQGGTADENAATMRRLLAGETGPLRNAALLNAAAALYAAGHAATIQQGLAQAAQALDTGAATSTLENLIAVSREMGGVSNRS